MNNERLEWVQPITVEAGVVENVSVLAIPRQDGSYDFYDRSFWDVCYYPVKPTPELNNRLKQELYKRR